MNNHKDENEKNLKQILSSLKGKTHIPDELIIADAKKELSEEGHSIVQSHLRECQKCVSVYSLAKESIVIEKEYDTVFREAVEAPPMSANLKSKAELVALLNSRKDQIVEEIAMLFLPEEQWFVIKKAITVIKNCQALDLSNHSEKTNKMLMAAFSSNTPRGYKQVLEIIEKSNEYTSIVFDKIVETCSSVNYIKLHLQSCVENVADLFVELREEDVQKIYKLLSKLLLKNDNQ